MKTRNDIFHLDFFTGFIVLLALLTCVASADIYGPKCLSCEGVENPSDCLYTKRCWAHEQCFTEHLANSSGATWYNFGCKIQGECTLLESVNDNKRGVEPTVTLCERCCTGDACNTHLCSTTTGPQSRSCFACDNTDDPNACHVVKHCGPHEVCYAESVIEDSPIPRHTLGCVSQSFCHLITGHIIGRRAGDSREKRKTHLCQKCCQTSGCNSDICFSQQPIPQGTRATEEIQLTVTPTPTVPATDIRLVGIGSSAAGRLEVYHDGQWGTVCNDFFNAADVRVACRQLGFSQNVEGIAIAHTLPGSGPIWLDDVHCTGDESSLFSCGHTNLGETDCYHQEDVFISCGFGGSEEIRLVGLNSSTSGRLEVSIGTGWSTVCSDYFNARAARVACRQLGLPEEPAIILSSAHISGSGPIWLFNTKCDGNETSLFSCNHSVFGQHNCHHNQDVVIKCGPDLENSTIRLVNGASDNEGRVEVFHNGVWGTVCDDDFTQKAAMVVCGMLGYPRSGAIAKPSAHFGQASKEIPILLDDVTCHGTEGDLGSCRHRSWGSHNCKHLEDVGVICPV